MTKPFLKWAGGKTQLIDQISTKLPREILARDFTYIEPFIGGGAFFFWVQDNLKPKKSVINDINFDLTNCYRVVQENVVSLIEILSEYEVKYWSLVEKPESKKTMFYDIRTAFNASKSNDIEKAAQLIFLNKTCFNGLYRVNRKGYFNVPIGSYKKPAICNEKVLKEASIALQNTIILNGDYAETLVHSEGETVFYIDPPYKPLSASSSFNAYAKGGFDDNEQVRLSQFCAKLDENSYHWILSNSDVNTEDNPDTFFDELYSKFNVQRVMATRAINSNREKRGQLKELLISNR